MKKGKNLTALVLALEIASIVILHTIKIRHTEKPNMTAEKEPGRNNPAVQAYIPAKSNYTMVSYK